jgi:NADPH:quinone reductase-like Zn-dependent oxidoreductase
MEGAAAPRAGGRLAHAARRRRFPAAHDEARDCRGRPGARAAPFVARARRAQNDRPASRGDCARAATPPWSLALRALRYDRYGPPDVLRVADVVEPSPAPGEVKIRVHAASLNPLDWKIRAGHVRFVPLFQRPPRGVGVDFAGEIAGVGGGAIPCHVGQRVFGTLSPFGRDGALAEYVVAPARRIATVPEGVTEDQAATLPIAGGTALQALCDEARVAAGQRVLIVGAAGGVGHFAVQIAKHAGACVVGVCGPANVEFVRSLGADEIVDYTRDDFARRADRFNVVFDAAGASTFVRARGVLADDGCYLDTAGTATSAAGTAVAGIVARLTSRQRAIAIVLRPGARLFERLAALVQLGAVRPHIERTVGLADVAGAMQAMESGHGTGKIVVHP